MGGSLNLVLYEISIWVIPALIAITFHEVSHGLWRRSQLPSEVRFRGKSGHRKS